MKVLHVSGATAWGGNEQQLIDIIPALQKLNISSVILGVKESPLHKKSKEHGIEFIFNGSPKLNNFSNYLFLKKMVTQTKADLIHLHTSNSLTVFVIADLLFGLNTPTLFSKKGMGRSMSWLSLYKYNYKNLNAILCVSKMVKKSMSDHVMKPKNHNKLQVVYEGINVDRINNHSTSTTNNIIDTNKAKFIIGNIANHSRAKDLNTLFRAIHYLVYDLNFQEFHVYQIGDYSNLTDEYIELIDQLNIKSYITLTGFVANATSLLPRFSTFVMSSEREGLPLTIYEAFYKKVPIVSTKAGGIPEVIENGYNGYLVDVNDHVNLAFKIRELLNSETTQKEFVQRSYKRFQEHYNSNKTAEKMLEAYNSVIHEK